MTPRQPASACSPPRSTSSPRCGLAGGRVDRIAAAAAANKRAIYDYFGDKEGLFDAAVSRVVGDLNEANPLLGG